MTSQEMLIVPDEVRVRTAEILHQMLLRHQDAELCGAVVHELLVDVMASIPSVFIK